MRVRRDRSRLTYGKNRRHGASRGLFLYGLLLGGILVFVFLQFDRLQLMALDVVGYAPTPTPFASEWARRGAEAHVSGDLDSATALMGRAVDAQPNNVAYIYEYAILLIEQDRTTEADEWGQRAIDLAPTDPRGYAVRARALMWTDPTSAIPYAITGLDYDPNFAPLHAALAIAYTQIGRFQEALTRGAQAVALDPTDADAHRSYSIPLIYVGRYQQAIEQLEIAIELNPNLTAPYFELAALYNVIDFPEMAVAIYHRILEIDPENPRAYLRLCETYSSVGEFVDAQDYCEQALVIDPQYAEAYRELGRMQYNRRNYEAAIESFETCVEYGSQSIECWYLRGLAHWILGQCDQGWDVLTEALERARAVPDNATIIENIRIGLQRITQDCPSYIGRGLPTAVPPTPIPPTPIGGFGG